MAFFGHKHELKILLFSLTGNSLNVTILYLISEQKFNQMNMKNHNKTILTSRYDIRCQFYLFTFFELTFTDLKLSKY